MSYLVICGRASARPMESPSASLESPLDSSKHIIARLLCPVQHSLMQEDAGVPAIGILRPPIRGSERPNGECPIAGGWNSAAIDNVY